MMMHISSKKNGQLSLKGFKKSIKYVANNYRNSIYIEKELSEL